MYDPIRDWITTIKITVVFLVVVIFCAVNYRPYKPKEEANTKSNISYVKCDRCGKSVNYESAEGYFIARNNKCKKCYIDYAGSINAENSWSREKARYDKDHEIELDIEPFKSLEIGDKLYLILHNDKKDKWYLKELEYISESDKFGYYLAQDVKKDKQYYVTQKNVGDYRTYYLTKSITKEIVGSLNEDK